MELARFESEILLFIQNNLRLDFLTGPMRVFSWFGNTGRLWIVVTLALLIPRRSRRWGLASAFGLILSLLVCNLCLKPLVARIRPYETFEAIRLLIPKETDASFPSGHSSASFASAWALRCMAPKRIWIPAVIVAALVALSRLYFGIHYPTDVLAGVALGMLVGWAGALIARRIPSGKLLDAPERF